MANNRPTLYVGVTNNIERRSAEHRYTMKAGFTEKYKLTKLVYFEHYYDIKEAIKREKQLKHWNRNWKLNLIHKMNPRFEDLYNKLVLGGRKQKPIPDQVGNDKI